MKLEVGQIWHLKGDPSVFCEIITANDEYITFKWSHVELTGPSVGSWYLTQQPQRDYWYNTMQIRQDLFKSIIKEIYND